MLDFFGNSMDLKQVRAQFQNLTPTLFAESKGRELATFRIAEVVPGDILFVPAGYLLIEQTMTATNIGLRVSSGIMTNGGAQATSFLHKAVARPQLHRLSE